MAGSINFQDYLDSISHHYAEWWKLYTLTDIEGKKVNSSERTKQATPFDFGLLVQSVKKETDAPRQEKAEKLERRSVLEGLHKSLAEAKHVLLIGRPGSGKSTALARLLLEEAQQSQTSFANVTTSQKQQRSEQQLRTLQEEWSLRNEKLTQLRKADAIETGVAIQFQLKQQIQDEERKLEELNAELTRIEQVLGEASLTPQLAVQAGRQETSRIPVLVELRYYKTSVLELIQAFFRRHNLALETHEVETLLSANQLLLLIDGLNELSSEVARQEIVKLRNYRNVPMVFTTRDLSLGGDFGIEKQWEMLPLTEAQMQEFIRLHLSAEQAGLMWRQLKDRTRKFAETPLLLWMLCELFAAGEEIPHNLGETFRLFTRAYENSSIRKHEVAALKGDVQPLSDRRLWFSVLKHLAYVMMQGETAVGFRTVLSREEAEQELKALFREETSPPETARNCLDDLLKYHFLQIKSGNEIEFHHQLFQEYYAAEWLLERLPNLTDEQLKYYFLNYLKWTEAIALMMGLLDDETQAVEIVKQALEVDLMLGARLTGEVKPVFQEKTVSSINTLKVPEWLEVELLGETKSEKGLPRLLEFIKNWDEVICMRVIRALEKIGGNVAVSVLSEKVEHCEEGVRTEAVEALVRIGGELSINNLRKILEDAQHPAFYEVVRILWIFGEQGDEVSKAELLRILKSPNSDIREEVEMMIEGLDELGIDRVNYSFIDSLFSSSYKSSQPSKFSVEANELIIENLLGNLREDDSDLEFSSRRLISALTLGSMRGELTGKTLPSLINILLTEAGGDAFLAISAIQKRCEFYNHEIAQSPSPPAVRSREPGIGIQEHTINNFNGNINAPGAAINLGGKIQGDQIGNQSYKSES